MIGECLQLLPRTTAIRQDFRSCSSSSSTSRLPIIDCLNLNLLPYSFISSSSSLNRCTIELLSKNVIFLKFSWGDRTEISFFCSLYRIGHARSLHFYMFEVPVPQHYTEQYFLYTCGKSSTPYYIPSIPFLHNTPFNIMAFLSLLIYFYSYIPSQLRTLFNMEPRYLNSTLVSYNYLPNLNPFPKLLQ